jgi:hypothetical protein
VIHKNPKIFLDELILVSKYFIEYQFEYQKGILVLFSYFLIAYGDKKQKTLLTFYWVLVLIYSFIVTTHPKKNDCTNFQSMLRYKNEFS